MNMSSDPYDEGGQEGHRREAKEAIVACVGKKKDTLEQSGEEDKIYEVCPVIATHLFSNSANMPSRSSSTANKPISAGEIFTDTELSYKHYTFVLGHVQHESSRRMATVPPTWLPPRRRTALPNQMRKISRTATPN